jgi:hypothetical protein
LEENLLMDDILIDDDECKEESKIIKEDKKNSDLSNF